MCMAKQLFYDEFRSLDASRWSPVWGKFDPDKGTQMRFTDKNISFMKWGGLQLNGTVATGADAEKAPFLSAMVNTRKPDKGEILFQAKGQFIVSVYAKLPTAGPSWPGIWMTGTKGDWPACGEIDILEAKGWQVNTYQVNTHTPRAGDVTKSEQHAKVVQTSIVNRRNYESNKYVYLYSVAKLNDRVDFYLEDQLVHTVKYSEMSDPSPFTDPENGWIIHLSHIIGGSFLDSGGTEPGHNQYVDATQHKGAYPSSMSITAVSVVSLDEPGEVAAISGDIRNIAAKYVEDPKPQPQPVVPEPEPPVVVPPTPSPQPPTPSRPEPPVVVTPTPAPAPVPKPRGERVKGDWVREEDALVFIMM